MGNTGERFIAEKREAERPAGAAVGTQVEAGAQGQHQLFPHTPQIPDGSLLPVEGLMRPPKSQTASLSCPQAHVDFRTKKASPCWDQSTRFDSPLCCILSKPPLFFGTQFPHLDKPVQLMALRALSMTKFCSLSASTISQDLPGASVGSLLSSFLCLPFSFSSVLGLRGRLEDSPEALQGYCRAAAPVNTVAAIAGPIRGLAIRG